MRFCVCIGIHNIITYAKFGEDWLRGLGVAMGQISGFLVLTCTVDPYNTPALPCEFVILVLERNYWRVSHLNDRSFMTEIRNYKHTDD